MQEQPGEQHHGDRNKVNWCIVSIAFNATAVLHVGGPGKLMWDEQRRRIQCWSSRFNAFLSHIISHSKPCSSLAWAGNCGFNSSRSLMLESDQMTSGAGHRDSYVLYCLKLAEHTPPQGKVGCTTWCRVVPPHFLGVFPGRPGKQEKKKREVWGGPQVHFCLGTLWCLGQFNLIHKWIFQVLW